MNKFQFGFEKTLQYYFLLENSPNLQENFSWEHFYNVCLKICELEALTFQSTENQELLNQLKTEHKDLMKDLLSPIPHLDFKDWRLVIGAYCSFMEWCHDVDYFLLTKEEQDFIFPENPLEAFDLKF